MASIYRDWRILASIIVAACLIVGAYIAARGTGHAPVAEAASETALLQAVATKDSTGDGLPDWEKSLYGIPLNASTTDYFGLGMTDGEAVARGLIVPKAITPAAATSTAPGDTIIGTMPAPASGSLTDLFGKQFFTLFWSAEQDSGGSLTSDQINSIADQALSQLASSVAPAPDFKTAADIKTIPGSQAALMTYAGEAEEIFKTNGANEPNNELWYLQDFLNNSTPSDITALQKIAGTYQDLAAGIAAIQVPNEAASAHLALVNSLARLSGIITDFSRIQSDPLATMLALQQYQQTGTTLQGAFANLSSVFTSNQISIPAGAPGAAFIAQIGDLGTPPSP